jgi:hypothetical protein
MFDSGNSNQDMRAQHLDQVAHFMVHFHLWNADFGFTDSPSGSHIEANTSVNPIFTHRSGAAKRLVFEPFFIV